MADGFGFIRSDNFLPGENDVYVAPSQIRRFGLRTGDIIEGNTRIKTMNEKFSALCSPLSVLCSFVAFCPCTLVCFTLCSFLFASVANAGSFIPRSKSQRTE